MNNEMLIALAKVYGEGVLQLFAIAAASFCAMYIVFRFCVALGRLVRREGE